MAGRGRGTSFAMLQAMKEKQKGEEDKVPTPPLSAGIQKPPSPPVTEQAAPPRSSPPLQQPPRSMGRGSIIASLISKPPAQAAIQPQPVVQSGATIIRAETATASVTTFQRISPTQELRPSSQELPARISPLEEKVSTSPAVVSSLASRLMPRGRGIMRPGGVRPEGREVSPAPPVLPPVRVSPPTTVPQARASPPTTLPPPRVSPPPVTTTQPTARVSPPSVTQPPTALSRFGLGRGASIQTPAEMRSRLESAPPVEEPKKIEKKPEEHQAPPPLTRKTLTPAAPAATVPTPSSGVGPTRIGDGASSSGAGQTTSQFVSVLTTSSIEKAMEELRVEHIMRRSPVRKIGEAGVPAHFQQTT